MGSGERILPFRGVVATRLARFVYVSYIVTAYVVIFWILLPAFLIGTGRRLDFLWPVEFDGGAAIDVIGWSLLVTGVVVLVAAIGQLALRGRGPPISHLPPTALVQNGLYGLVRHPIYLGYTVAFAGLAIVIRSFWCLAFSTPLLLSGWIAYVLFYEEPALSARFGKSWASYRRRTPLVVRLPRPSATWLRGGTRLLNALADKPIAFTIGPAIIVNYGFLCAFGTLLYAASTAVLLLGHGLTIGAVNAFIIGGTVSTFTVAWLFWWLGNLRTMVKERFWGLGRIGFVSFGGLAGGLVFALVFARIVELSYLVLADVMMQGIFFAYAFGRLGCLTFGCCYGKPTQSSLSVTYRHPQTKVCRLGDQRHISRNPVQLYSATHGIIMVVLLNLIAASQVPTGVVTAFALMLAGLGRTFTESYRDRARPILGRFTVGHAGSWATFFVGWLLLFVIVPDASVSLAWSAAGIVEGVVMLPAVLASAVIVLIVYGLHWREIGVWFGQK